MREREREREREEIRFLIHLGIIKEEELYGKNERERERENFQY